MCVYTHIHIFMALGSALIGVVKSSFGIGGDICIVQLEMQVRQIKSPYCESKLFQEN